MTSRPSLRPALLPLLALLLVVLLPSAARAQETPTKSQVYVQRATSGELTPKRNGDWTLRLNGVESVTVVAGTPAAQASEESLKTFAGTWRERGFKATPPDAALVQAVSDPDADAVLLTVTGEPEVDGTTVTYTVVPLDGAPGSGLTAFSERKGAEPIQPLTFADARLFISDSTQGETATSLSTRIRNFANNWSPLVGIVFMIAIIFLIWRSLKMVPRTAPQTIKPAAKSAVTWEEIAGADDAKEELMEVVQFLRDPKKFRRFGATMPKGVLLHGPPGTGKTLLAKAVAHESGAHFFSQSAASFVEMFAGLGAARIRRLFAEARKHAPAIIFIDELDAVGGKRGDGVENSEREQTLNQLLVEMDGFVAAEDIVVMAASNLLDKLDPALLRPGRFDRQVFVSPPDVAGREEILKVHTRTKPVHDVNLRTIAAQTSGLTGADLANLCNEAAIFCARRDGIAITQADFDMALERVIAGVQSKRVLQPAEKRVVAYHEAGHALCAELLPSVDTVHKISVVPRGKALGFTLNLPEEDRYLKTRDELLDHMAMLLGGRVAEQIVFGKVTTGASDDLKRVSDITYAMVHEYAMGTADSAQAAQRSLAEHHLASEVTRRIRDEEQRELAYQAQAMAERLITEHRDQLDALAQALLDNEVLEREQIDEIMAGTRPVSDRPPLTGIPSARPTVTAAEELRERDT